MTGDTDRCFSWLAPLSEFTCSYINWLETEQRLQEPGTCNQVGNSHRVTWTLQVDFSWRTLISLPGFSVRFLLSHVQSNICTKGKKWNVWMKGEIIRWRDASSYLKKIWLKLRRTQSVCRRLKSVCAAYFRQLNMLWEGSSIYCHSTVKMCEHVSEEVKD